MCVVVGAAAVTAVDMRLVKMNLTICCDFFPAPLHFGLFENFRAFGLANKCGTHWKKAVIWKIQNVHAHTHALYVWNRLDVSQHDRADRMQFIFVR